MSVQRSNSARKLAYLTEFNSVYRSSTLNNLQSAAASDWRWLQFFLLFFFFSAHFSPEHWQQKVMPGSGRASGHGLLATLLSAHQSGTPVTCRARCMAAAAPPPFDTACFVSKDQVHLKQEEVKFHDMWRWRAILLTVFFFFFFMFCCWCY